MKTATSHLTVIRFDLPNRQCQATCSCDWEGPRHGISHTEQRLAELDEENHLNWIKAVEAEGLGLGQEVEEGINDGSQTRLGHGPSASISES